MVNIFLKLKEMMNRLNPNFGFVNKEGDIIFKPKNHTELLKFINKNQDTDLMKINLHCGRIRTMLQEMNVEYMFENVKQTIETNDVALKFKQNNPTLFHEKGEGV